ncbi:hypothetical protein CTEN210_04284 [Chaetoceros tenuissimus]|uniref:Uncharacterized protein n=1 Tax=Chaetoceros tenuissimus TaxID=426638 RepID=A0AAD3H2L6_9STRA|nr:hypothetical protein CTEN210_04284 [Chaetoceros tenuissimus]
MQTNQVVLDSLPYIDQVHPDYEAYAMSLIEEEMKTMEAPDPPSSSEPKFNSSSINHVEYQQLVERNGEARSDTVDFTKIHTVDPKDKKKAIHSFKIQLEHERIRQVNLELEGEFSSSIWKHHVGLLEKSTSEVETQLQQQLMQVDQINANRKESQEKRAMVELGKLGYRYEELVRKNQHLNKGIVALENEVETLRAQSGSVVN